jgi:hypothetical protein
MTGRGAGYCAGNDAPGSANPGRGGLGLGRGRGGLGRGAGRGRRNRFGASGLADGRLPQDTRAEADLLREQLQTLEGTLEVVKERLEHLDSSQGGKV